MNSDKTRKVEYPLGTAIERLFRLMQRTAYGGELGAEERVEYDELVGGMNAITLTMEVTNADALTCLAPSDADLWRMEQEKKHRVAMGWEDPELPVW